MYDSHLNSGDAKIEMLMIENLTNNIHLKENFKTNLGPA